MELELGFKITQTRVDVTSTSNLLIAKDRAGPVFVSRETDTMFILTAHLKGFTRDNVEIKINEDGSQITINGKKPVQEIVLRGWKVYKNDVEMKGFAKTFRIPDEVVLDKIKAKFSDDDSVLTISMPKLVKGIRGIGIEEVSEEQEPETTPDKVVPDDDDDEAQAIDGEIEETADKESEVPKEAADVAEEEQKEEASQEMEQPEKQDVEEGDNQVKETLETQNQNQSGDVTAQDEEHSIPPEPKQDEPEAAQLPRTEETASEEEKIQGEKDQTPQAMEDGVSNREPVQHCEGKDKDKKEETHGEMQQECQKQEPISDVQEPNQEETLTPTPTPTPVTPPADGHKDDEIEEAEVDQLGHSGADQEPQKAEEQNEIEQGKKNGMERCKLGVPIIIAGSAFLVSLFVYVVHSIRTKKRS